MVLALGVLDALLIVRLDVVNVESSFFLSLSLNLVLILIAY